MDIFLKRTHQKLLIAHRRPIYQIKGHIMFYPMQQNSCCNKDRHHSTTLNLATYIIGKCGNIWEVIGKYCIIIFIKSVWSKGINCVRIGSHGVYLVNLYICYHWNLKVCEIDTHFKLKKQEGFEVKINTLGAQCNRL